MVVLGPPRCYEDDDHRVRAISTSAVMRTSQGCRHGLRDRSFLSDPRADRSHRFVGDTEIPCHAPQSFTLGSRRKLCPLRTGDARFFDYRGIVPNSGSSPPSKQAIGVQQRNQRQRHHIYLA
jgi:hypothetical protein